MYSLVIIHDKKVKHKEFVVLLSKKVIRHNMK